MITFGSFLSPQTHSIMTIHKKNKKVLDKKTKSNKFTLNIKTKGFSFMIVISREKKEMLDEFGSYKIIYNLKKKDEKKTYEIIYNAKDDDFIRDSDFYIIKKGDKEFYWKKKQSKYNGFLNKELEGINGIKELLRFLFESESEIDMGLSVLDNEFHPEEWKKFTKKIGISYDKNQCFEVWKKYFFMLSNHQILIEDEIKSIERSLKTTKREDYKNELLIKLNYLNEWSNNYDNKTVS